MGSAVKKLRGTAAAVASWNVNAPASNFLNKLEEGIKEVSIESIITSEPFISLFIIRDDVYSAVLHSIKEHGYDKAQPLIVWREKNILIDGHTRLKAAKEMGIKHISIIEKSFADEEAALDYVYKLQFARRNLKDGELMHLAKKTLERYKKSYGEGGKADYLSKRFVGLSVGKAKKLIAILDNASGEELDEILKENVTINFAYENLKMVRPNHFQKDKISLNISPKDEETLEIEGIEEYAEAEPRAKPVESKLVDSPKATEPAAEEQTFEYYKECGVDDKVNKHDEFVEVKSDETSIELMNSEPSINVSYSILNDDSTVTGNTAIFINGEPSVVFLNSALFPIIGDSVISLIKSVYKSQKG
jgi:ParB family chromosome partitioning protein